MRKKLLLVSLVIALLLVSVLFTSCKPASGQPATTPSSPLAALQSTVNSLQSRVSSLESRNPTDISSLSSSVSTLRSDTQSLKDSMTSLQSTISSLQSRISVLESRPSPTATSTAPTITPVPAQEILSISMRYPNSMTVTLPAGNSTTLNFPIKLKLENNVAKVVDEIILSMELNVRASLGLQITDNSLISDLDWVTYSTGEYELWDELTMKSLAEASYQMIYSVTITNILSTPVTNGSVLLSAQTILESYDVN